ncbi:hypothetical protein [Kamptonema sp. UHCC 0994]|uniref:hypothetical protein n=1 Tax=Kamptonema sp. UHCC 0994 TaxID=3031329 RepID=UPI0023BB065C|nr:hypothetical protein [Kamptonema sp. UHCC 0994]MDF0556406.1 hypothetical protein [Kamptonema sp. UHCC 0994]
MKTISSARFFFLMVGLLAIFCCFSLVRTTLEKATTPLPDKVGFYLFMAFLLAVCLLTAISCFYFLLPKNWENYEKSYEYDLEEKPPLNIQLGESGKELVKSDALITEDKLVDISCEAFWNSQWYEGKIIRQLKLRTGIGKQFCRIYLVEMGMPPVRQWLSADLIRQPSADRLEPEEYH